MHTTYYNYCIFCTMEMYFREKDIFEKKIFSAHVDSVNSNNIASANSCSQQEKEMVGKREDAIFLPTFV